MGNYETITPGPDNTVTDNIGARHKAIKSLLGRRFPGMLAVP
jgi:hypothetical protein